MKMTMNISITMIIIVIIGLAIGGAMFVGGYKLNHWASVERDARCYHCPNPKCNFLFNKAACSDCNITLLNEQEYGPDGFCNDMGGSEMSWKIGAALMLMGIAIPLMYIFIIFYQIWYIPRTE
jgi:hypothetical protein